MALSGRLSLALLFTSIFTLATATNEAGLKYLEENKSKEGVVVLPSGLQYKVLKAGEGAFHPKRDSPCLCHYAGTLIDGTEFDSSYSRGSPTTFAPSQVIAGWTEAMQLMVEGDKWELYIPSDLAYGERGSPPKIGGGDALVFTIEMIEIQGDKVPANKCDPVTMEGCNEKQSAWLKKAKTKFGDADELDVEKERLIRMGSGSLKPDLKQWIDVRVMLLEKLIEHSKKEDEL